MMAFDFTEWKLHIFNYEHRGHLLQDCGYELGADPISCRTGDMNWEQTLDCLWVFLFA